MTRRLSSVIVAAIVMSGIPSGVAAQTVTVFPNGDAQTWAPNITNGSVQFGLQGTTTSGTYFREIFCYGQVINCGSQTPSSWTGQKFSITVNFQTSTSGTGRIVLKAYISGQQSIADSGWFNISVGTNGVSVTPDLQTSASRPAGTGPYSEQFTITNTGTLQNTYSFSCTASWLTCGQVPAPVTIAGGAPPVTVNMPYTVGTTVTTGTLTLTATGTSASDQGQYQVPIIGYNVSVTPDGTVTPTRDQGTTYSETFTINNTGADNTFNLTCSQIGTLTCVSVNPPSIALTGGGPPGSATVTYTTGGSGTSRLTLTATGTGAGGGASDDGYYMVPVASYGVAVTPDGGTEPTRPTNTGGYSATFNVKNTGSVTENFSFNCVGLTGVTCTSTPSPQNITNDPSGVNLSVSYNVGAVGTGTLQLTATSAHVTDAGTYSVPIGSFSVSVGPDGNSTPSRPQNTGGYVDSFTVSNGGTVSNTYTFTCTGSNGVVCGTVPGAITLAGSGGSQKVGLPYSVGSPGTGRLALKATGSGGASDSGWFNVPIACTTCFSIVPDGNNLTQPVDSSATVNFGGIGLTPGQSYFREVFCSGPVINCASPLSDPFTYSGGMSLPVNYTTASTPGSARVRLRVYQGGGGSDSGWVNINVVTYGVAVTPDGDSTAQRLANTGGFVDSFTVANTGTISNTFSFSCTSAGTVVCGSPTPSPVTVGPGAQVKVGMPYSVGGNTAPNRLILIATGTKVSDQGFYNVRVLSYQVVVTPKGTSTPPRQQNTGGYTQRFTIFNGGSTSNTFSFVCAANSGVTCGTPLPGPLTLAPLTQDSVAIPYNVGSINTGTLIIRASGTNTSDTGYVTVPIVRYGVAVTPDGGTTQNRPQNTGGYAESFTVTNTGTIATDFTFTCIGATGVTCGTPPGMINIKPDSSKSVSMPYGVGTPQMGKLTLRANGPGVSDTGFYNVVIVCSSNCFNIVPDGTNLSVSTDTTATASFGGSGLIIGQVYSREILCTGPIINCGSTVPDPFTYSGGMSIPVTYTAASTPGQGRVRLRVYQGGGGSDSGWFNITVQSYGVAVTPDGDSTVWRLANTGGYRDSFVVKNTGTASNTYSFNCAPVGTVVCDSTPTPVTLPGGAQTTVWVRYSVGGYASPSRVRLFATGTKASDDGYREVPVLTYQVVVTPDGATAPGQVANTAGHSYRFGVYNGGSVSNTFTFTCTGALGVTCGTMPSPRSVARFTQDSVDIPYTTGAPGTGKLTIKATGTNTSDTGFVSIPMASYGVTVLPDGGTATPRQQNSGPYSESFTVKNTGSAANTYTFVNRCSGTATCGTSASPITLQPDSQSAVPLWYFVGAAGSGTLTLQATGTNASDTGYYSVQAVTYSVAVTPAAGTAAQRPANSGSYSESFTVQNTGNAADTYALTCESDAPVTCVSVSSATLPLGATAQQGISVTYNVGGVGTGAVRLKATGSGQAMSVGSYTVPVYCNGCFTASTVGGGLFNMDSRYVLVETAVAYDSTGRIKQHSDARSNLTNFQYGGNSTSAFLTKVTRVHDATGAVDLVTTIGYDNRGQVDTIKDEGGSFRFFFYDSFGRLNRVQNTAGVPVRAYGYRYSRTSPNWTFDPANPNAVIDSTFLQQTPTVVSVVKTGYVDGLGRDIQSVVNDGANSQITATQYDAMGRVWRAWKPYTRSGTGYDPNFVTNATAFYNAYHGTASAKPYTETAYTSDALARVKQVTPEYIGTTAVDVERMVYGVDPSPLNQTYVEATDEGGARTRHYRDLFGNEVKTILGYGASEQSTTQHSYDVVGQRTQTTDPRNLNTAFSVDTRGLLVSRASPDAGVLNSKFDRSGNARFTQDANQLAAGQVLFTNYDFVGRALVSGLGAATFSALDPNAGPTALETTQASWLIVRQYDTKPATATFPWSRFSAQINPLVLSNTTGRLTASATKSNGAWQISLFSYDADGQVATRYTYSEANGGATVLTAINTTVSYVRDLRGSLTRRSLTVGTKTFNHWYDYDARGMLWKTYAATSGTKPATADVTDTYRPGGQVQNYQFAGGPLVPLHYTIRQRLDSIGNTGSAAFPFSARYVYNANGTIAEAEFYNAGSAAAQKRYRYQFPNYDALHRVKSADFSSWSGTAWTSTLANDLTSITYDAGGNLLSLQRYRETATLIDNLTYSYPGGSNRLNQVVDAVAPTAEAWDAETGAFTYDPNGNVTTAPAPYAITAITYSNQNLPLAITRSGTTTAYRYDHAGERIAKRVGTGNTEVYVREGASQLGVFTVANNGNLSSWYFNVLVADRVVGRQPGTGSRRYYHTDALGSTRSVVQGTTVVEAYDFEPWGLLMPGRTFGSGTKETFSGKEQDTETGLAYFGARYYMPALGRWAAVDPAIGNPEWSPYVYVEDNPASQTDPDGRQVEALTRLAAQHPEFVQGVGEGFVAGAQSTWHMISHPIQTAQGIGTLVAAAGGDPAAQLQIAQGVKAAWKEAVTTWNSGERGKGQIVGRALEAGAEALAGGAIAGAVAKAGKGLTLAEAAVEAEGTAARVRTVAQRAFDYAVENPRRPGLNRMQLGKQAEVQATRVVRKWAERNGVEGLQYQVRGANSIPDIVLEEPAMIFDFKLTPKAVRPEQAANFAKDFPGFTVDYIFGPGPWR